MEDRPEGHPEAPRSPDLPALLREAGTGDDRAWRTIIDLYGRRVYALAKSRCGRHDVAEEVTQSVFVTVASKLGGPNGAGVGGYTESGRFEAWLFRIVMNRIRDEMRRLKRHADPTDPAAFDSVACPALPRDEPDGPASLDSLRAAVAALSDADREIVELRHHAGLSFKQMSDLLDEPLGTLLARHHRALKKLKNLMTAPGTRSQLVGD